MQTLTVEAPAKINLRLDVLKKDPAIKITGPVRLNLNGYILSGNEPEDEFKNVCIQIKGNGAKVWNGTVANCEDGIEIKGDRNRIISVTSSDNDKRGFRVRGDKNLLFNCTATNNGRKGFSIEGEEDNLEVTEKADDNLLLKCLAEYNGQQGFVIEIGDGNKIYDNSAIANCRDGIEINGGSENHITNNIVEDNGNKDTCGDFGEPDDPKNKYYYKPWFYAGIAITAGIIKKDENDNPVLVDPSNDNQIKYNHACGNRGCNGDGCNPRERNYWDENLKCEGDCASFNDWENNIGCPECTPLPAD